MAMHSQPYRQPRATAWTCGRISLAFYTLNLKHTPPHLFRDQGSSSQSNRLARVSVGNFNLELALRRKAIPDTSRGVVDVLQ